MIQSICKSLLILFLPFATMADAEGTFSGSWKMAQVFDNNLDSINLPAGDFILTLQPSKDFERAGIYDMSLALTNRLGGRMTVIESDDLGPRKSNIQIGPIRSTMMMPEQSIFRLEVSLTDIMPDMNTVELVINDVDNTAQLVFEGPKGKLVCVEALN
jgi:hypothetical protein